MDEHDPRQGQYQKKKTDHVVVFDRDHDAFLVFLWV